MHKDRTKLLIGGIYIVRVLILRVILDIEREFPNDFNQYSRKYFEFLLIFRNALLISSMIYHSFKEIYFNKFPIVEEENSSAQSVIQGRKIRPREVKSFACR
jgi:hypothetical protein